MMSNLSLATIILTLNEEVNIARSVISARQVGHVVVLDSGSTDATTSIARRNGAEVKDAPWRGFAEQRELGLTLAGDYRWVLFLDADETLDAELATWLEAGAFDVDEVDGYLIARSNFFLGKQLRYAGRYPDLQLKLMRRASAGFDSRPVHERASVTGQVRRAKGNILHNSGQTVENFLEKHATYARLEAVTSREVGKTRWVAVMSRDRLVRRRWVKEHLWLPLPCRGLIRFVWLMLIKQGFRDGLAGYAYAKMLVAYEGMIDVHIVANRLETAK